MLWSVRFIWSFFCVFRTLELGHLDRRGTWRGTRRRGVQRLWTALRRRRLHREPTLFCPKRFELYFVLALLREAVILFMQMDADYDPSQHTASKKKKKKEKKKLKKDDLPQMGKKKKKKSHFAEVITRTKPVFDPRKCREASRTRPLPGRLPRLTPSVSFQRRKPSSSTWTSTTSWTTRTSSTTFRAAFATGRWCPTTSAWPRTRWGSSSWEPMNSTHLHLCDQQKNAREPTIWLKRLSLVEMNKSYKSRIKKKKRMYNWRKVLVWTSSFGNKKHLN